MNIRLLNKQNTNWFSQEDKECKNNSSLTVNIYKYSSSCWARSSNFKGTGNHSEIVLHGTWQQVAYDRVITVFVSFICPSSRGYSELMTTMISHFDWLWYLWKLDVRRWMCYPRPKIKKSVEIVTNVFLFICIVQILSRQNYIYSLIDFLNLKIERYLNRQEVKVCQHAVCFAYRISQLSIL